MKFTAVPSNYSQHTLEDCSVLSHKSVRVMKDGINTMSVSVDDTGKELPVTNAAETRATDAVRELKRGASCKDVLETLWPSEVDEASLGAFARLLRNDAILARCPPKPSYLRQVLAKAVSRATDAGFSDDALCEE